MLEPMAVLARLLLGSVFLIAGVGKKLEGGDGMARVVEYDLLPRRVARAYGAVLPWLELATGALLLAGPGLAPGSPARALPLYLAQALLASFAVGVAVMLARGRAVECHCFGRFGGGVITPWTLGRNLALLSLAVAAFFEGSAGWSTLVRGPAAVTRAPGLFLLLVLIAVTAMFAEAEALASAAGLDRQDERSRSGVVHWQPQG